jgi:vacuolar-type H+-ATPase subunit B/Vma2
MAINEKVGAQSVLGIKLTNGRGDVVDERIVPDNGPEITTEFIISREFSSANEFSLFIERQSIETGIGCMDSVINYCNEKDIDIEVIAPLINKSLKEKIRAEAEAANMMQRSGRLPL